MKYLLKILILLLLTGLFFVSVLPDDWYSYIGKQVSIETSWGDYYSGKVDWIMRTEECDGFPRINGECLFPKIKYTLFLKTQKRTEIIHCEDIINIEEDSEEVN